ncbi:hypothetical protein GH741_09765 [Aquibacillus halophilus]|uniref:Pilus assembly protein PilO n=1 Tax=Aquibacillus halophilus TaxID=930132 RepID=A0A6A8DGZ0_9BACI|nr:hypothetical protein [Aquibacillus halophilus]MRH42971.1 hypothetical protein [Aquibacillus halophilus]
MIAKWSRIHIIILILSILAAISVYFAGYYHYVIPVTNQIEDSSELLTIQENTLANTSPQEEAGDSSLSTESQRKLPVAKDNDRLLITLNDIASNSNSVITEISITEAAVGNVENTENTDQLLTSLAGLTTINYQLQVSVANYQEMYSFLQQLTDTDRLLNIDQLIFGAAGEGNLDFSVTLSTFYSPSLLNLQVEAPTYDFQPSAEKTTPFPE